MMVNDYNYPRSLKILYFVATFWDPLAIPSIPSITFVLYYAMMNLQLRRPIYAMHGTLPRFYIWLPLVKPICDSLRF